MKQQTKLHFGLYFQHARERKVWASHIWENDYFSICLSYSLKEQGSKRGCLQFHLLAKPQNSLL